MSFIEEIDWLKVIDALNKSNLSGRDFYKREFAKFCPGAIPCYSLFGRYVFRFRNQIKNQNAVSIVRLPNINLKKEPEISPATPIQSKLIRLTLKDGSTVEFFSDNPEKFALNCLGK